jgi:site-specific DNA-methyltransferase (adenine-specific)
MSITPDWQSDDGSVTLYRGDCLRILPELEAGSVDAVVTDPPFGIGFKYATHKDTPNGYSAWLWGILQLCESLCSSGSPVFVWQAMKNATKFAEWFPRPWRIFAACKNFVQMRPTAMQYSFDPVLVWWMGSGKPWSAGTATRDYHVADTTPGGRLKHGDVVDGHPCPRPLHQVAHIVEQWVRPSSTVLDPFMGSGTTGVACVKTGRKFIGIEKDPAYFEIAKRRIQAAITERQGRLIPA